jgi:hypothetical protein
MAKASFPLNFRNLSPVHVSVEMKTDGGQHAGVQKASVDCLFLPGAGVRRSALSGFRPYRNPLITLVEPGRLDVSR